MTEDTEQYSVKSFNTKMMPTQNEDEITSNYDMMIDKIKRKMSEFQQRDSGWALAGITHLEININKYQPVKGGSQYIRLSDKIQNKQACINVKNDDQFCFKWAIISALCPPIDSHSNRPKSYNVENITASTINLRNAINLEFDNMEFPLKSKDIVKFQELNQNISVNVFGLKNDEIFGSLYCTKSERNISIKLLLLEKDERSHYVSIKSISKLISKQITKNGHRILVCNFCLIHFHSENQLMIHKQECNRVVTVMPNDEISIVELKNYERQIEVPFVIYGDSECILQKIDTCAPNPSTTSISYFIKCSFNESQNKLYVYKGVDCANHFVESLVRDIQRIYKEVLMNPKPMVITDDQKKFHMETNICHICNKAIVDDKVVDHCHFTGKYRGPAHQKCNLQHRITKFVPILFHNFFGYDCHLFVKSLEKVEGDINLIPLNKEVYVSLSKRICSKVLLFGKKYLK